MTEKGGIVDSLLNQTGSPALPGTISHGKSGERRRRLSKPAAEEEDEGPRNQFTDAETKLLMEWQVDAKHRLSEGHSIQAGKFHEWEVAAGMITITICTVAATMAMGTERKDDGEVFKYFLCILSVFGTIVSFVFANTQFIQRHEQHRMSWISYTVFANDAETALARHAAGDKSFNAQRHLDILFERWKELKGPALDIPILPDPARQEPPTNPDTVIRKWMASAENQEQRHQYAAKAYDTISVIWRTIWMFVATMCAAFSLGTFLPKNTRWFIAFSYLSLILNIFAVLLIAFLNFERYSSVSDQHQFVARQCRTLRDYTGKLLAQRSSHRGGDGSGDGVPIGESLEVIRSMLNEIALNSPVVPAMMNRWLNRRVPTSSVFFRPSISGAAGGVTESAAAAGGASSSPEEVYRPTEGGPTLL